VEIDKNFPFFYGEVMDNLPKGILPNMSVAAIDACTNDGPVRLKLWRGQF